MPYTIEDDSGQCPDGRPHAVLGPDGLVVPGGCHETRQQALDHQRALTVNVHGARAARAASEPVLVTRPEVELAATGTWRLSTGETTFTSEDFAAAVGALACPSIRKPVIKLGHVDPRFDGEPGVGRVENMHVAGEGTKLVGDLAGIPAWLDDVMASAYPDRSIEGFWDFACQQGHVHPFVVTGLALLGVAAPGVGVIESLADVAALYGVTAAGPGPAGTGRPFTHHIPAGEAMPPAGAALAAGVTAEDVRRKFFDTAPWTQWISEIQLDPLQAIIADDATGKTYRLPIKLAKGGGGEFEFGDPVEVTVEYVDAPKKAAAKVAASWASRDESRDGVAATWDKAANEKNLGDDPTQGQLDKMYALPADTKTASKLPHHDVAADGTVGAANTDACSAAIGAINGARGGLAGVSSADKTKAYDHLAGHMRDADMEPPELKAAGEGEAEAGAHGPFNGEHDHPHSSFGSQGGDVTHTHMHAHDGDAVHNHQHQPAAGAARQEGVHDMDFNDEQLKVIRERLGKKDGEEVTAADIAAAFAPPPAPPAGGDGKDVPEPDEAQGMYLMDGAVVEDWRQRAAAGDRAIEELRRRDRDQVLAEAVRDGKFPQARREHYEKLWETDPDGTRKRVAALAKGVVPTGPVGVPGLDPDLPGDFEQQQAYRALYGDDEKRARQAAAAQGGGRLD